MQKILLIIFVFISACSPGYVIRAAYEETKILLARKSINKILENNIEDKETSRKLKLVKEARDFAIKIGLKPGNSFTLYSKVDKDVLSWILLASQKDAFKLHTWWFPIVGTVPYKGYFDKNDALKAAKLLEQKKYETWLRSTDAFSTLGWFNDPVLSTTLKNDDLEIVTTVIHEIFHSTFWFKNQTELNESMANFVGRTAAIGFYENLLNQCKQTNCGELKFFLDKFEQAKIRKEKEIKFSIFITKLYDELNDLYAGNKSYQEKLTEREIIFERYLKPIRELNPKLKILKKINNAEIMQLKLYLTNLEKFDSLFEQANKNWKEFFKPLGAAGQCH